MQAVKRALKTSGGGSSLGSTSMSTGGVEELRQVLNNKANKLDIERLDDQKSNKCDTE